MRFARRFVPLAVGATIALFGLGIPAAYAGQPLAATVTDQASDLTPSVPGGQCYTGANQNLCRRILVLKQVGDWIYAGGIIDSVTDRTTGVTTSGYHNIFRFSASTHKLDTTWQPQFYTSSQSNNTTAYSDSAITGIAGDPTGATIYVAGHFTTTAPAPGAAGVPRRGVAAVSSIDGSLEPFNARVCSGGGACTVNDVQYVKGTVWLGGDFSHVAGTAVSALAFVNPVTGALTGTQLGISGTVTPTVITKVAQVAVNQQQTQAVMIGNFSSVGGQTHKEVAVLDITASGGATINSWNDPANLNASGTACKATDTWARGVDWDPTGTYFDIAASGGGGLDAFGAAGALCDAFSRFKSDGNANTPYPAVVNVTGFDSLFTVVDTGNVVYTGGHNKYLDHAVYINGQKVASVQENHYGIGAIDVNPADPNYGHAIANWNNSTATGRGAGWASSLSVISNATDPTAIPGVYVGGDAQVVGSDNTIKRLAFFAEA